MSPEQSLLTITLLVLVVAVFIMVTSTRKKQQEEKRIQEMLDSTDELTQVNNKKYIDDMLERELDRARRNENELSFAIIEIDNMPELKHEYGQQFCKKILRETADNLRDKIRAYDVLSRHKNSFLCLFPETASESVILLSKRARAVVAAESFYFRVDGEPIHVSASIGATTYTPGLEEISIKDIKGTASKALTMAKDKGSANLEFLPTERQL